MGVWWWVMVGVHPQPLPIGGQGQFFCHGHGSEPIHVLELDLAKMSFEQATAVPYRNRQRGFRVDQSK
jgi:hypothetical protein